MLHRKLQRHLIVCTVVIQQVSMEGQGRYSKRRKEDPDNRLVFSAH